MIDTHCHLTDPRLAEQLDSVLERAAAAGVSRMVTIGTDLDDAMRCIELCRAIPNVRCAIGVHPNHSGDVPIEDLPRLRQLQSDPSVVALGEMGLDYHHHFAPVERQRSVFEYQLELATQLECPIIIHSRQATDDTLAILRGFPKLRAVFHCFTGSVNEARQILDAGFMLGFTGAATFKKNDAIRQAIVLAPMDRILVETDAPYLTPEPMRKQKTNEPALVVHVAAVVAQVKGVTVEQIDRITSENASAFYGWAL
jgi:TatD DNase family protein